MTSADATSDRGNPAIAVIIPCLNEEAAIAEVVHGFAKALPNATIYVYDNGSTDSTVDNARDAGAVVRVHRQRGKGNVVRRMFADIEADVYVMADGDRTYEARAAPELVDLVWNRRLDMAVGARKAAEGERTYPHGHKLGNKLLTGFVSVLFGAGFSDMLSGYRAFSRRFVKSFPAESRGFEIETELTIHALELDLPFAELDTAYRERPDDSESKLRTYRDGSRILITIVNLFKELRPFQFFFLLTVFFSLLAWTLAWPVILEYRDTGLVPRFPTAILAVGVQLVGAIFFAAGLILTTVSRVRLHVKRMAYLAHPGPEGDDD